MVNPLSTAADPQRYLQILEQLSQKWREIEVRTESILQQQENAEHAISRALEEANTQNESLPRLVQDHQHLTQGVRSMEASIKSSRKPSFNTVSNKPIVSVSSRKENENVDNVTETEIAAAAKTFAIVPMEIPNVETTPTAKDSEAKESTSLPNGSVKGKVPVSMDLGCHFIPTDQELIACLVKKVTGGTLPKYIQERDLYGNEEPRDIFKNNPASELYFVTPIKTKFDSGKKVDRIVGNGTWKIQNNKDIFDDPDTKNRIIGCKRTLNFMENTKGKRDSWIMHEYILKDTPYKDQARWAVCRVKRGRGNFTGLPVASSSSLSPQTSLNSSVPELSASLKRSVENDADAESNMPDQKKVARASDGSLQLALSL